MKKFWQSGEPFIWLTGGALATGLIMVVGLVLLIMVNGLGFFWPKEVVRLTLADGQVLIGQVTEREKIPQSEGTTDDSPKYRIKIKQGNRPINSADFVWIDEPQIVGAFQPNRMSLAAKTGFYLAKVWEFVSDDPRESNTEGGVFPAIFGTVMMVLIMSVLVTPLGVLAALYLREYAKQGPFVSTVRIAVNNLAGVPSIVFGAFGVGFFIYFVGGSIDRVFFPESLPTPTFGTGGILWASLTLTLMTVPLVIVATEEGLAAVPRGMREASLALGATKFETTWCVVCCRRSCRRS